jgi:hypothetical protein
MNDLTILHDAWPAPEPSPTARAHARVALAGRAAARCRSRRLLPRLVAVATVAAMLAAGAAVVDRPGGGDPLPSVELASAAVLERAAEAAESKPFTPPRADQWIYMVDRIKSSDGSAPIVERRWRAVDGTGTARIENGELEVERVRGSKLRSLRTLIGPFAGYDAVAALPTDPDALLRRAYRYAEDITGAGLTEHGDVYALFNGMLRDNVLPPELEAAIFRALKQVPGVTVERIDAGGRPALRVGQTEDWLREELVLDAETYRYLGESGTVVRDGFIDPGKAGNATGEIRKGDAVVSVRLTTAIVDGPGDRR